MNMLLDYATIPNHRLVELHLGGDREAFREIVERHQAMVCALGLSACGDVGRSEDLAQEVFVAAWKHLPELREPEKLRGWLAGIARNLSNNSYRREQRTPTARAEPLSRETAADTAGPRESTIRADEAALMWSALERIPETYREPMVLFYREQRSVAAVAATLAISEENVRQRLTRGRALLSERMAKLVEETLERSGPTPAFAGVVMLSLPFGVGPAAVAVTEAAVTGGKAVAGGTMSKVASAAGMAGGAVAKGGLVVKALSVVALLPALLGGFFDFTRFRTRHDRVAGAKERRRAAWAYLIMQTGVGVAVIGFFVVPEQIIGRHTSPVYYIPLGLLIIIAIWISVLAKRRVDLIVRTQMAPLFFKGLDDKEGVFEWRSQTILLGLPLHHVRMGSKRAWRKPAVRAWIAISDGRAVGGLFAMGPLAVAPISMGLGAIGLFSLGVGSIAFYSLGLVACGWVACGYFAAGWYAAKGIIPVAGQLAAGSIPFAPHMNDAVATAFFQDSALSHFAHYLRDYAIYAPCLGWIVPLVMTCWYLWRTREAR